MIKGPIEVLKIPEDFPFNDLKNIPKHLNLVHKDFFIYDYETFKTANLVFRVPSKMGRTDYEELMISVVSINEHVSPKIFQSTLKKFEEELTNIKNLYKVLYNSSKESVTKLLEIKELLHKYHQEINNIDGLNLNVNLTNNFPWGTHICYFYQKEEDLMDILLPYIKTGLENNEFCVWVISEDLNEKEVKTKLETKIKNFNEFLKKGQIEIFPFTEWYLKDGEFNFQRVLDKWVQKYNYAISHGFSGVRVTGHTAWVEKKYWKDFSEYEEEINNVVGNYRMIVLCTYCIEKCSIDEILGIIKTHQIATIRKEGFNLLKIFSS
ncbi:MAG: MEDS domain-containing protein [Candidatus Lokiarchaeota archaeon]|nr:MEDS domain-containing protein [Candidatus Lokiarchaeota archaeon]